MPTTKKEKSKSTGGGGSSSQKSNSSRGGGGGVDLFSGLGPSDLNHALDTDLDLFGPDSLLSGNLLPDLPTATGTRKSSSRSSVIAKSAATTASNNRTSTSSSSSTALTSTTKNKQYNTQIQSQQPSALSPRALPSTDTSSMYEELIQQRTAQVSQNYDHFSPPTIDHY